MTLALVTCNCRTAPANASFGVKLSVRWGFANVNAPSHHHQSHGIHNCFAGAPSLAPRAACSHRRARSVVACFGLCVAATLMDVPLAFASVAPLPGVPSAPMPAPPAASTSAAPSIDDELVDNTEISSTEAKAESRRHFQSGINLYEDKNFTAALAEFEAAYRQFPSASALQNVALCQKQLYRYSEARESLIRLERDHRSELNPVERSAIEHAIAELASLIGSVRLTVTPVGARVALDGHSISPDELRQPIVLDVGEHRVTADAPGFAPVTRQFLIAGGHVEVPLSVALTETTGVVTVTAPDAQTAIAVDGRPVAFAYWSGRLEPGRHFVQVYREGYEPFEEEIDVEVGGQLKIKGVLGERIDAEEQKRAASDPNAKNKRPQTGFYGLASLGFAIPRGQPLGFDADSDYDLGWSLGLRAGYRLLPQLGLEAAVDSGGFSVHGHCASVTSTACTSVEPHSYRLDARRFGAAIRLFSSNETYRLVSAFGGGLVSHDFRDATNKAAGLDPYVSLEAGVQANWRHSLWEVVVLATFDGASSIHVGDYRPYAEANGIQMFGLGLRIGWGEWLPSRPPLPPMPQRDPSPTP